MSKLILIARKDVEFTYEDRKIGVKAMHANFQIKDVSELIYEQFQLLKSTGYLEDKLIENILQHSPTELSTFLFYLENMKLFGIVNRSICSDTTVLASLNSSSTLFDYKEELFDSEKKYILSRFILSRRKGNVAFMESPLAFASIHVYEPSLFGVVYSMTSPKRFDDLLQLFPNFDPSTLKLFLNFLCNIDGLSRVDASTQSDEDKNLDLKQWEFHNLLFHARSRMGRHNNPSGASFPFVGEIEPSPAIKPLEVGDKLVFDLFQPDIEQLKQNDLPFTKVLEERKSIRQDNSPPIDLKQLGEFLYRSSRVREFHPIDLDRRQYYETTNRPYPSGGSSYELELYLVINKCMDLESGIYYYKADTHQLVKMSSDENYVNALLSDAWLSAAKIVRPQVLISISCRFQRLNWKYRSMGYSASVKNVGVLYQTMYLVATAMGLSACALGNGNGDLLGRAVDLNYLEESTIGEFMLGS